MLVIEGNVYYQSRLTKCCVGIEEGKIIRVKKVLRGEKNLDFGDKLILPAGIDVHVHFREPGFTYKEDFSSGSMAAAFGGISTVLDMPNTEPPTLSSNAIKEKAEIAREKCYVDFGIYCGVIEGSIVEEVASLCTAFKLYMGSAENLVIEDKNVLKKIFSDIGKTGKVAAVHCESQHLLKKIEERNLEDHMKARKNESEVNAVRNAISMSNDTLHICHVSARESLDEIRNAKLSRKNLTCEVSPHHLLMSSQSVFENHSLGKVNPPLRTEEDRAELWNAFVSREIDILASDHAPHTKDEKKEFSNAPSGMPGVETMIPLMLFQVRNNSLNLERLMEAIAEKPADLFGISKKGRIIVGNDADILVVDMRRVSKINGEKLHSKCGWTAFENHNAVFPRMTFIRGEAIIEDWELIGEPGYGRFIGNW